MVKEFDRWNSLKKSLDQKKIDTKLYFYEREVWWCSLGLNVGVETDGKHDDFERPVLIVKKFNSNMVWSVPLTGMPHNDKFHKKIRYRDIESWACITQIRTLSTKRLLRKLSTVDEDDFIAVVQGIIDHIQNETPLRSGESRSPKALI